MIYKFKSISCNTFAIFFHLWSGGGPNWHMDYDLWCAEQKADWTLVGSKAKKSFADVVRSNSAPKKSVFVRLLYPSNHVSNFLDPSAFSNPRQAPANHPRDRTLPVRRRVLRWIQKDRVSMPESSKPDLKRGAFQFSNSKPAAPVLQPGPSNPQQTQCEKCLGLGHARKDCNQQIRCRACFNYGNVSSGCLSKKREKRRYHVVSRPEAEASCSKHINPGNELLLEPSVSPTSRLDTTVHQENPNPAMAN